MKPRLTSYYDPDDPPRATRMDEAHRLLAKTFFRLPLYLLYVWAVGGDVLDTLPSLIGLGGWRLVGGLLLLAWAFAPLAISIEHFLFDTFASQN